MNIDKVIYVLERMSHSFMGETKEAIVYALKMFEQHKIEAKSWQIKIAELEEKLTTTTLAGSKVIIKADEWIAEQAKTIEDRDKVINYYMKCYAKRIDRCTAQAERLKELETDYKYADQERENLKSILTEVRATLKTPEGYNITLHSKQFQAKVAKLKGELDIEHKATVIEANEADRLRKLLDRVKTDVIQKVIDEVADEYTKEHKYLAQEIATALTTEGKKDDLTT